MHNTQEQVQSIKAGDALALGLRSISSSPQRMSESRDKCTSVCL